MEGCWFFGSFEHIILSNRWVSWVIKKSCEKLICFSHSMNFSSCRLSLMKL